MLRLVRLFPFLNWPRPDAALLRSEALAGLTVGLMVIPQGVAYAALAGMPLVTGIYAAMLPCCRRWWRCCSVRRCGCRLARRR